MDREQILERVRTVLSECLSLHDVDESTHLFRDLNLDSIQQLTFVVELEDRFRICFDEDDEVGVETVGDIVSLIVRKLGADDPAPTRS
jgi:acyl carrier protein